MRYERPTYLEVTAALYTSFKKLVWHPGKDEAGSGAGEGGMGDAEDATGTRLLDDERGEVGDEPDPHQSLPANAAQQHIHPPLQHR